MDEAAAKAWFVDTFNVPRETMHRLEAFAALLAEANLQQNLVARSTLDQLWVRHIVDSAQLVPLAPDPHASWLDLGSGAGFPGLIVALLHQGTVTLVEERRLRAEFLARAAQVLGLQHRVEIICNRLERLEPRPNDVISARAFAPLDRLFAVAAPFSTAETRWILPKGRNAKSELEDVTSSWQGVFRAEPSLTDPDAFIIVAEAVRRRSKGSR